MWLKRYSTRVFHFYLSYESGMGINCETLHILSFENGNGMIHRRLLWQKGVRYMTAHISNDGREESVKEHTQKTAFLCSEKGKRCGLSHIMLLCGILHDMGKNKEKFATYLHADERTRRKLRGTIAHASTGAKYVYDKYHDSPGNEKVLTELIAYAVAAHHGLFDCVDIERRDIFSQKVGMVDDYQEAFNNAVQDYLGEYDLEEVFADASGEFGLVWSKIKEILLRLKPILIKRYKEDVKRKLSECKHFFLACLQRLLLSILIDSDWEATSDFMEHVDTFSKDRAFDMQEIFRQAGENFEAYMEKMRHSVDVSKFTEKEKEIYNERNSLQNECRQFAAYPAGIYCLPIPTGGGKTLSSLAYALEFCRLHPETERIIYISPYISVTEQNAEVFRNAVGNGKWIMEHHSSVVRDQEMKEEGYENSRLSRYDMNWEEPFICTTFVQFMNTLFSNKSESIRRMHRLIHAVVIIDEVQSMPIKCVHTFNYMINFLQTVCHTNVILCTATQPTLEEAECPICYSNPKYMIDHMDELFRKFERVNIDISKMNQTYTLDRLGTEIMEQSEHYMSILVVLNTKSAVRKLYDNLKERNVNVEYLTTNLCAQHRSDKLAAIKETLKRKQESIVVISTNLIEAGVDISFQCVYRSMAGLDSLAQTAGRCNRNGEMEHGVIHLMILEGENTGNMEELQQNIRVTEDVIGAYNQSEKTDSLLMPAWMNEYYKNSYFYASDHMNFPIKELDTNLIELLSVGFIPKEKKNFMNQAYKTAGCAYRVIDDASFGVIVPYKKGEELIASIQASSDVAELKAYIRQAQRYTVNVRENQLKKLNGLIQPVSGDIPELYMVAAPGAYSGDYGITPEWETLII